MSRYPTDEELERFMEQLTQEELYAPRHLKEEILHKMELQENSKKPVSFFSYTLKMVAGMAAAIILTFAIPINNGSALSNARERTMQLKEEVDAHAKRLDDEQLKRKERLYEKNGERVNAKQQDVGEITEELLKKMNHLWNKEIGGK